MTSSLARLQRALVLGAGAALAVWLWYSRQSLAGQIAALLLFACGHTLVLGGQFLWMRRVNRQDPVSRASAAAVWQAWWRESMVAPRVFAFWQPFAWRQLPDTAVETAGVSNRRAVVLVHGFVCNRGFWRPWMQELRARDVPYATVNLEPVFGSIDAYAPLLEDAITRATRATGLPPLVVAHSMGGLVVRAWMRAVGPGAETRVHHVITLGSPHHGTWLGRLSHVANGRQMSDRDSWLPALAAQEPASRYARFTCWYSNCDNIVFPASTAMLPGADNRLRAGVPHVALAYDPIVMRESLARL